MARIRTVKPEFFTSEDVVSLTPLARLLYIALWCEADRDGRFAWKPTTFKLRYFPADDCDIKALCDELLRAGLVVLYGDGLAYIPTFSKHQHVNPRETQSSLPAPGDKVKDAQIDLIDEKQSRVATRSDASNLDLHVQVGKEGKERNTRHAERFDMFWSAYPKKVSKGQAEKTFAKLNPDDALLADILAALDRARRTPQWVKSGGEFIPHASTWLNAKGWEDSLPVERPAPSMRDPIFAGCL